MAIISPIHRSYPQPVDIYDVYPIDDELEWAFISHSLSSASSNNNLCSDDPDVSDEYKFIVTVDRVDLYQPNPFSPGVQWDHYGPNDPYRNSLDIYYIDDVEYRDAYIYYYTMVPGLCETINDNEYTYYLNQHVKNTIKYTRRIADIIECPECYEPIHGVCVFNENLPGCTLANCECIDIESGSGDKWEGIDHGLQIIQNPSIMDEIVYIRLPYATYGYDYDRGYHDRTYSNSGYSKINSQYYEDEVLNIINSADIEITSEFEPMINCDAINLDVIVSVSYYVQIDKKAQIVEATTISIELNGETVTKTIEDGGYQDTFIATFNTEFTSGAPASLTANITFTSFYGGIVSLDFGCSPDAEISPAAKLSLEVLEEAICSPVIKGIYHFGAYGYVSEFSFSFLSAYATEYNIAYGTELKFTDLYYIEYEVFTMDGNLIDTGEIISEESSNALFYKPSEEIFNKYGWEIGSIIIVVIAKDIEMLDFVPDDNIFRPSDDGLGINYPHIQDETWRGDVLFATFTDENEYGTGRSAIGCEVRPFSCNQGYVYPSYNDCASNSDLNSDPCCNYMPKDFIEWADGLNMKKLTPPNERQL